MNSSLTETIIPALRKQQSNEGAAEILRDLGRITKACGHEDILVRHEERVRKHLFSHFITEVNDRGEGGRRIVFVAHQPYFVILREALSLRRLGYRLYLVSLWPVPDELREIFDQAFDGIIDTYGSLRLARKMIQSLHPDIFHIQCWMWFYVLGRMVIENKGRAVAVCEFYDITSVYAERDILCTNWPPLMVDMDFALERFILERADALVHRFPPFVVEEWRKRHGAMPPNIEMQAFPCPDFIVYDDKPSRQDGITRFVFTGGPTPHGERQPAELHPTHNLHVAIRSLLEQGAAVDILHSPHSPMDSDDPDYAKYFELERQFPLFRVLKGVSPEHLGKVLSKYDYGFHLTHIDPDTLRVRESFMKGVVGTKIFACFEAGLPVLVNSEYEYMASIVTDNGLGLAVHSSELDGIFDRLATFDYKEAVGNIKKFNNVHRMDREIGRLVELYDQALAKE